MERKLSWHSEGSIKIEFVDNFSFTNNSCIYTQGSKQILFLFFEGKQLESNQALALFDDLQTKSCNHI